MSNYLEEYIIEETSTKTFNIIEYLPDVTKAFREIKEITTVENIELTLLDEDIKELKNNQFFLYCNERGISRFEEMLRIVTKVTDTLEDRKFRVLARYNSSIPYTYEHLLKQLTTLCGDGGFTCDLFNDEYRIKIRVELVAKVMYSEVEKLLAKILPANIVVDLDLRYNQHIDLARLNHGQLGAFTHAGLRNEYLGEL